MGRPLGSKNKADRSLISPERQAAIAVEAKAKVKLKATEEAEKLLLAELEAAEEEEAGLSEPQETVTLDLAPHADKVLLDSKTYFQGHTYTVRRSVAAVLREVMSRGWAHQSVIDGKPENFYRKQRTVLNMSSGLTTQVQLPRV